MFTKELGDQFILLRSQGMTFNDIADKLNVSRSTLMNWSRKLRFEIANQRTMNLEQLQQKYLKTYSDQINALGDRLRAVEAELQKRDLADLSTAGLIALADNLRKQILNRTEIKFSLPVDTFDPPEKVEKWTT
jgi:transcriptional regulator with XRE-family HTH domain